jgi:hypothetical protein
MREEDHKLPSTLQARAVAHLRSKLSPGALDYLRAFRKDHPDWDGLEGDITPFHFGTGMSVRNVLREVIKDDELPVVKYNHYATPIEAQNWDDWYAWVLEEAVA